MAVKMERKRDTVTESLER